MDIRCINEHGKVRYIPEHLTKNAEYMKSVGLRVEDIRLVGTKEVKGKSEEPVNAIDTITDEEIKPATDLIETKEEPNAFADFNEKPKKTRKTNKK